MRALGWSPRGRSRRGARADGRVVRREPRRHARQRPDVAGQSGEFPCHSAEIEQTGPARAGCASSGRLIPMTVDGSPSMPSTNQPPRPSRVKPPATGSRLTAAGVGLQLGLRRVGRNAPWSPRARRPRASMTPSRSADDAVTGVELSRRARHRPPALDHRGFGRRLAAQSTVAVEHRITADDNAIRADALGSSVVSTASALAIASAVVTSPGPVSAGSAAMTASSSTPETMTSGSIPALPQHRSPARGRRAEDHPGHRAACASAPPGSRAAS